jgi:acyl-CoA:acyl-CoA alkyltransferase
MRFSGVALAALAHDLPPQATSSEALEEALGELYTRLGLRIGRLELMSGIRERRHYPAGTRPSQIAARAAHAALARCPLPKQRVGLLVHTAVCRDFLEPATACAVHRALDLPPTCQAFDLSNACLGFINGLGLAASLIEAGRIEAALVVTGEDGGPLVRATLADLSARANHVDRAELKRAMASLTIGSGGAAAVLCRSGLAPAIAHLHANAALSDSSHVELCQGDQAAAAGGPLMATDSEALLEAGVALAARTWPLFLKETGWSREQIDHFVTHQVGRAHRRALFERLALPESKDHPTVEVLGNVGSASLPLSLSLALETGRLHPGQRLALLGIGSGLQCEMLGLELA